MTNEQNNLFLLSQQFTEIYSVTMVFDLNVTWTDTENGSDQLHVKAGWEPGELSTQDGDE